MFLRDKTSLDLSRENRRKKSFLSFPSCISAVNWTVEDKFISSLLPLWMVVEFKSISDLISSLNFFQLWKLETKLRRQTDFQHHITSRLQPGIYYIIFKWLFQILWPDEQPGFTLPFYSIYLCSAGSKSRWRRDCSTPKIKVRKTELSLKLRDCSSTL